MRSLNTRLGGGLLIALLVVFAMQWFLVSVIIRHVTEEYIATRMSRDVEQLVAALTFDASGTPNLAQRPEGLYDNGPFSGQYFQIAAGGRIIRSESMWDESLDLPELEPGAAMRSRLAGPVEQSLLALSMGFRKQGHALTVTVAEDISDVDAGIHTFERLYLLFSLGMMSLLLLSQWLIVRRSLKPLTASRLNLERIARGESGKLPDNVPLEIRPLVAEINLLLELLTHRLERTRTAIGNLAHKLKTPLSLLSQLRDDPAVKQSPAFRSQLSQQIDAVNETLERELSRVRLAGDGKSGRRFVAAEDLKSLVATLERVYRDRELVIELDVRTENPWPADREDMLELFGNLLDNACKWARGRVRMTVGGESTVVIEDDGPGCPPEQMESLRTRGRRLDETMGGHGLGLSIANDIVAFYKGVMELDLSPAMGGLRVRVDFPAPNFSLN